ncbi:MAG: cytochrome c3 family protein [Candidatus Acidiferrales bacterium]
MRSRVFFAGLLGLIIVAVAPARAQDIDTVVSPRNRNPATIADQISDPTERAAFLSLYQHKEPQEMLAKSQDFLEKFPQSAFVAQAYEVAARSCFDLGRYSEGLEFARQSLTFLPENALLLVSVADVESHQKLNEDAISDARKAVEYLDRFSRPATVKEREWPELNRKLKASAYFAMGRALLAEALDSPDREKRAALLQQSEAALTQARALNPADLEIAYLKGLARVSSGELNLAASDFAEVYKAGGMFAPKALENLKAIYKALEPGQAAGFDGFLAKLADQRAADVPPAPPKSTAPPELPEYAGSEACKSCHGGIYRAWSQSGMSKMFRPYAAQNVIGDFEKNNEFFLGDDEIYRGGELKIVPGPNRTPYAKMTVHDGRHFFSIKQSDGQWHNYPVDYTIGSKWQQAYATQLANGEIKVFPIQYNAVTKQWVNFWKIIDEAGSARADLRNWENFDPSTTYQTNCAICHTSQLRDLNGGDPPSIHREYREPGIDCEMCHGPSERHIAAMNGDETYNKAPLDPPVDFAKINNREFIAVCSQCHMQSALRVPGPRGEINYSRAGQFFMKYESIPFDEFSRKGFYKDGRFRQTTFIVESLERSQCFVKGQVTCATCHNPHSHDESSNLTSLKFPGEPDRMCTGCHAQFLDKSAAATHTHHSPESEGSRCVSCHMPKIMDAVLMRARTHKIDSIPSAEFTIRFGQEESPNACLLCHSQKDAGWVKEEMQKWKPVAVEKSGAN